MTYSLKDLILYRKFFLNAQRWKGFVYLVVYALSHLCVYQPLHFLIGASKTSNINFCSPNVHCNSSENIGKLMCSRVKRKKDQYKLIRINPELSARVNCLYSQFWFPHQSKNCWHRSVHWSLYRILLIQLTSFYLLNGTKELRVRRYLVLCH